MTDSSNLKPKSLLEHLEEHKSLIGGFTVPSHVKSPPDFFIPQDVFDEIVNQFNKTISFLEQTEAGQTLINQCLHHYYIEDITPAKKETCRNILAEHADNWLKTNPKEVAQLNNIFKSAVNLSNFSYAILFNEHNNAIKTAGPPQKFIDESLTINKKVRSPQ